MAEKKVNIYIPREAVGSDEKMKKVYINDVMYCIPVGKNVEVPESVAKIITEWLETMNKIEEERENRLSNMEDK